MLLSTLRPGSAFVFWSNPEPVYIIGANGVPVNTETGEETKLHPESIVYQVSYGGGGGGAIVVVVNGGSGSHTVPI